MNTFENLLKDATEFWNEYQLQVMDNRNLASDNKILQHNMNRYQSALSDIADFLNIEWWEGEFPFDEVIEAIKNRNVQLGK